MAATQFFGKCYKNRVFEDIEKTRFLGKKRCNYFLPVFKAPPRMGVIFGFFFPVFLFLLHLARGCSKKNIFIGFLNTLLKHLVTSCSNNEVKPNPPPKCTFFSETPFLTKKCFLDTNFAPPPENCAQKISKKKLFL